MEEKCFSVLECQAGRRILGTPMNRRGASLFLLWHTDTTRIILTHLNILQVEVLLVSVDLNV